MDEQIKISVIIPVYGVERYIERCVRSLMEQTIDGIEFIFVDDCSRDASVTIAQNTISQYPDKNDCVRWVHHPCNKGLPAARNTGLSLARGEYIYHCDSDDYLDKTMLEKLYLKAKSENLDFVWCDFYRETAEGTFEEKTFSYEVDKTTLLQNYLVYGWNVVWNTICKRDIYKKNNIRSLESISFCEDFELMSKLLFCSNSWNKIEEPLYYYNRLNSGSMITQSLSVQKLMQTINSGIDAVSSLCNFARNKNSILYSKLETELNWRMLKAKTYLFFFPSKRQYYLSLRPECNKDIDSNPLCSRFQKSMQKLIISPVTAPIVWAFGILFRLRTIVK